MSTTKSIAFAAAYTSATFNDNTELLVGLNGVVTGGEVTTSGGMVSVAALTFIQKGLCVSSDIPLTVGLPVGLVAPYYVVVTTSSSVENLGEVITPTFAQRPEDISANSVLVAEWDGQEWRALPKLQLQEILFAINLRAVKQNFVGISSGFDVAVAGGDVNVSSGSLIDTTGQFISKSLGVSFPVGVADVDGWDRIDQVYYRRPLDASTRTGQVEYLTGQTFDPSGANALLVDHTTATGMAGVINLAAKTLVTAANEALFLYLGDYGARQTLYLQTSPEGLGTVTSAVALAVNTSSFDAILNPDGHIDVVYARGNNLYHAVFTTTGTTVFAETLIAAVGASVLNPKIVSIADSSGYLLHIVFEKAVSGSVHDLYYVRLNSTNTVVTNPIALITLSSIVTNPSIDKDDEDDLLLLAYENQTTGRVYLAQYDAGTPTLLAAPTLLTGILELDGDTFNDDANAVAATTPGTQPIVKRGANKTNFVFWRHFKGSGNYGIAVYSANYITNFGHKAFIPVLTGSGENIMAYDVDITSLNYAHFTLRVGGDLVKESLILDTLDVVSGGAGVVAAVDPTSLHIKIDAKGSLIHTWAIAASGSTNDGSPLTTQFIGAGSFGGNAIASSELAFLQSAFNALPSAPTVGDTLTVSGSSHGNDGTFNYVSQRVVTVSSVNYVVVMTNVTFTTESPGPTAQFQTQAGIATNFAKTTAGIFDNLRGFYVPPSDVYIAHYRVSDGRLAVSGTALEEDQTISRLYDFFNTFGGASGTISWQEVGTNKLALTSNITLNLFNRQSTYTIAANPGGIVVGPNQVVSVILPDTDAPATLPLVVTSFGAGVLDRYGKRSFPLFWNIGGFLYMKFAPFRIDSGGETIVLGGNMSAQLQAWLGVSTDAPDPANHGYTHTSGAGLLQSDSIVAAISKLDEAIATITAVSAEEETHILGPIGTNTFNAALISWSADPTVPDIDVFVDGQFARQDLTGGNTAPFKKTSSTQLIFNYTFDPYSIITVKKAGGSGGGTGGPLNVEENGVTVDANVTIMDFRGSGVSVTEVASGHVQVNVAPPGTILNTQKAAKNNQSYTLQAGYGVSWVQSDGSVDYWNASDPTRYFMAGIVAADIPPGAYGYLYRGGNVPGVLSSLGALPGATVFMDTNPGGFTLTAPNDPDAVIEVGIAEPPDGVAQANAVDLFFEIQVISE